MSKQMTAEELMKRALEQCGVASQLDMVIEGCAELIRLAGFVKEVKE